MSDTIIVALIAGLCTGIPSVIATVVSNRSNHNLMAYRIDKLEEKVTLHNNLITRMYEVEKKVDVINADLKNLKK